MLRIEPGNADPDPPEAHSALEQYAADADRDIVQARESGGYGAVLELAERRRCDLKRELAALTAGQELRVMNNAEREELRRQWTPEKARLNDEIVELNCKVRDWTAVADGSREYAANEALGWTIMPDGTSAKPQDNGKVLSVWGGIRYEEDGEIVDTSTRSDEWLQRHRRITREFGERVRAEQLAKARRARPARTRQCTREHRPATARRTSSSSRTSSADPGSDSSDSDPAELPPGRPCARNGCEELVHGAVQKKYCGTVRCDTAREAERQQKHRHGDQTAQERDALLAARQAGYAGKDAFAEPGEHSLSFLWRFGLAAGNDPGELLALRGRACRCNGHHIDGGAAGCLKCGLPRRG